ncbi:arabinose transporter [Bradyrhizobium sp. WYCCWR 13023]|uniref:Arabinose transporter n=1 Tax=Bradyrhizobium zhengyangense TaxID=2911009 RepID=A0A9X1RAQ9_9BRAD|nr:arabinose transporter [Bradyrhizobium zhengyangense]MCG2628496.1 arabinose transporter [Bradyrhizobium zhengyangense]MCG2665390.1 arabinose transporter [Bradyrhizobium zhengyangense]
MSIAALREPTASPRVAGDLLPIMGVVFVAFLVIGVAMPVLPLHVHDGLGLGTLAVGVVAGSQFGASLISRPWAGHFSDRRGAKRGVVVGLVAAAASGLLYLLSLYFSELPLASVTILLLGRGLLGAAESFIITAAVSWGLALADARSTGKVIAWVGSAMFAAFAIGAPTGAALYAVHGFAAIAIATAAAPLMTLLLVVPLPTVAPIQHARPSFTEVVGAVWVPGLGSALGSVGFGAVTTFVALLFANRGWANGWLAYTAYATAFILARICFSHLADAIGGAKVALACALIEAVGQILIWLAVRPEMALAGAALTGFGFSLVYPGFGVEAVRRVPAQSRGMAMGAYTAFLDLAQGLASPVLGLIATGARLNVLFLASALTVLCAALVAWWLLANPFTAEGSRQ